MTSLQPEVSFADPPSAASVDSHYERSSANVDAGSEIWGRTQESESLPSSQALHSGPCHSRLRVAKPWITPAPGAHKADLAPSLPFIVSIRNQSKY